MNDQPEKKTSKGSDCDSGCPFATALTYLGPAVLAALVVVLYAPVAGELWKSLWGDSNNSHGLLVPFISAYLVWRKRKQLAQIERRPSLAALALILIGAAFLPVARAAEVAFLADLSLFLLIGGIIWHIWGSAVMREILFPYLFLFFMIPWPSLLVETLTFHLQFIAAKTATLIIGLLGLPAARDGVNIAIGNYSFEVAAPCSGMRSLAALMALGALCAYLLEGGLWKRLVLLAAVPPLALIGNATRIVVILLIAHNWGTEKAEGFYHGFSGVVVFLVTFLLLLTLGRALGMNRLREDFR